MRFRQMVPLCVLVGLLTIPSLGWGAEPSPETLERARVLYDNAVILYEEGSYEAAMAGFRASLELSGAPELHFNIASCLERMGKWDEAYSELNLYRAYAPAEERERLERRLRMLEEKIAASRAAGTDRDVGAPVETGPSSSGGQHPRWGLVGVGVLVAAGGGAGAALTWSAAQDHRDAGDQDAYEVAQQWNRVSLGAVGVGVVGMATGFLVPVRGTAVMVSPGPQAISFSLSW